MNILDQLYYRITRTLKKKKIYIRNNTFNKR